MNIKSIMGLFSSDLAVDLGTINTLVYAKDRGVVVNEPSLVAVDRQTGKVEAYGVEAAKMLGRMPARLRAGSPVKDGVIADSDLAEKMLSYCIQKVHNRNYGVRPRIVIGVPYNTTQVEKKALIDSAFRARASEVLLVEESLAAALGADMPIMDPAGSMIVDIGGGTTEVGIISMGGIVFGNSIKCAGIEMDRSIKQYVRRERGLLIGDKTAEELKIKLGSASPLEREISAEVKGRGPGEGVPRTEEIKSHEIREALGECIWKIIDAVHEALEQTPPEITADIMDRGIVLTGGGSLLRNLDRKLMEETGLPVFRSESAFASTVLGIGKMLAEPDLLKQLTLH